MNGDHSGKGDLAEIRFAGLRVTGCVRTAASSFRGDTVLEAIAVILLFVIVLGVLNRIEFGSFD